MSTTLHVRIGRSADRSDLEDRLTAIDAGDDVQPRQPSLSIENVETFGRVFRPTNLTLLQAIVEHQPASIRELARVVDRHPPEVLENANELADYGLVEFEREGRSKRPIVPFDAIDVEILLGGHSADSTPA